MAASLERTLIIVKPEGVARGLVGHFISQFERSGFKLIQLKAIQASEELIKEHYSHLAGYPFFPDMLKYMQRGHVVPMVWEGPNIVREGLYILGSDTTLDSRSRSTIHVSENCASAEKEIALWFKEEELSN